MQPEFKYDVAFSFLSTDLGVAEALADLLAPTFRVFVYVREKEELLGQDGMRKLC